MQNSIQSVTPKGAQAADHSMIPHLDTDKIPIFTHTRRFVLEWNNCRVPPRNRRAGLSYYENQRSDGVLFGNGLVALAIGKGFETMGELETLLMLSGTYQITWIDP